MLEKQMISKSKIEILFLIPSLKYRGAERMLVNLANHFNHERFSIHVVSLSSDNPMADQIHPEAATFKALPRSWRYDMAPARALHKLILHKRIHAILAFDIFSFFYAWMALWGIRPKPKIFISIHNIRYQGYRHWLQSFLYARLLTKNEIFLSVCNAQIEYWSKTYHIPRDRFTTIHNGVDTDLFSPSQDMGPNDLARKQFGIPKEAFVILQVASLAQEKRHEDAFSAVQLLIQEIGTKVVLVCVGEGTEERRHSLDQLAHEKGVYENILFCGTQSDVRPFFEISDLFTLTSSTETFSMAALEAMSMGVPCVLTDVGGAREMIVEGMNGYLVRAGDPLHIAQTWSTFYRNRHIFNRKKIRDWTIANFSLSECTRKYEHLLGNIFQK